MPLLFLLPWLAAHAEGPLLTDNPDSKPIDWVVRKHALAYMNSDYAKGVSIGVLIDGACRVYNYGEVVEGSGRLPSADDFFGIGSIDKTFAATMLAHAVVEGRVDLDDDIRQYLPDGYGNLSENGNPIRLAHLANHTSGLPQSLIVIPADLRQRTSEASFEEKTKAFAAYGADSLLDDLKNATLDSIPGEVYRYNNHDTKLLVLLLERIYRKPYAEFLEAYLRDELGMLDTRTALSDEDSAKASVGHWVDGEPQEFVNFEGFIAGPTIISTVNDMLIYIRHNLQEANEAIALARKFTFGDPEGWSMGLGWMMDRDSDKGRYIYHTGSTRLGFNSLCVFYPEKSLGFVIMANEVGSLERLGEIENGIMRDAHEFLASAESSGSE